MPKREHDEGRWTDRIDARHRYCNRVQVGTCKGKSSLSSQNLTFVWMWSRKDFGEAFTALVETFIMPLGKQAAGT